MKLTNYLFNSDSKASELLRKIIEEFIAKRDLAKSISDMCKGDLGRKEQVFISAVAFFDPELTIGLIPEIELSNDKKDSVVDIIIASFIHDKNYDDALKALEFIVDGTLKQVLQELIDEYNV